MLVVPIKIRDASRNSVRYRNSLVYLDRRNIEAIVSAIKSVGCVTRRPGGGGARLKRTRGLICKELRRALLLCGVPRLFTMPLPAYPPTEPVFYGFRCILADFYEPLTTPLGRRERTENNVRSCSLPCAGALRNKEQHRVPSRSARSGMNIRVKYNNYRRE